MQKLTLKAPAKINLYLNVLGKRKDGYHEIESVAQTISVYDILHFEKIKRGIQVICDHPLLPSGENNLVYKAARLFFNLTNLTSGVKISVEKKIPLEAGLGGGSTDAASTLLGLNLLFDTNIPLSHLVDISSQLGTDVPFCLIRGTALLRGRGDKVYPLPPIKEGWIVLVYPKISISTSWVYSQISPRLTPKSSHNKLTIDELKKKMVSGKLIEIKNLLYNKLEEVVIDKFPILESIKQEMKKGGAKGVLMSGSGSTIFGIVEDVETGKKIANQLREKGKTFLAQPTENKQGGLG